MRVPASTHNTKVKSTSMLTSDIMALTVETDGDVPGGRERPGLPGMWAELSIPVSYTHLTLPTNREV